MTLLMTETPKNFGIIGVAGYIAVRHLQCNKRNRNNLLASLDNLTVWEVLTTIFLKVIFLLNLKDSTDILTN